MAVSDKLYDLYKRHPHVTTDSRNVPEGSLFFALRGERFDGNRFAADALERGAAYAVVDDPQAAVSDRYIVVGDTLRALQELAAHHRRKLGIPLLAITGTNGKTTTKELTARVLSRKFRLHATRGNLNNHIGVPLTLLSIPAGTEFAVVEMGAGACGEIAELCRIAAPDYGIITNIGRAHLEGFGSPEGVKRGKGELFDRLAGHGGTAFVCEDDPILADMAHGRPDMKTIYYGLSADDGMESRLVGEYNRYNVAAAATIGRFFGVPEADIRNAIESYVPDNHRSQRMETERNTVIADCYNANPSSMRAAIGFFAAKPSGRPKTAILGDMLELGAFSVAEHTSLIEYLAGIGIPQVILVGACFEEAAAKAQPLPDDLQIFPDTDKLATYLREHPVSEREVLLKGSNGIGLDKLILLL